MCMLTTCICLHLNKPHLRFSLLVRYQKYPFSARNSLIAWKPSAPKSSHIPRAFRKPPRWCAGVVCVCVASSGSRKEHLNNYLLSFAPFRCVVSAPWGLQSHPSLGKEAVAMEEAIPSKSSARFVTRVLILTELPVRSWRTMQRRSKREPFCGGAGGNRLTLLSHYAVWRQS